MDCGAKTVFYCVQSSSHPVGPKIPIDMLPKYLFKCFPMVIFTNIHLPSLYIIYFIVV